MSDIFNNEIFEAFAGAADNVYIYVCDMATDISRWSRSAVDYFALEDEYISNAATVWAERIHPDDIDLYTDDITKVFAGTKKTHDCQYRAKNYLGEYVWVECKGSVIRDNNGNPKIFAGLMTRIDGQSKYDNLTGLLTTQSLRDFDFTSQTGAALLFGIDGFRKVMGHYGYNTGDEILVVFAKKIKSMCKPNWKLFRFSGDEFLLLAFSENRKNICDFYKKVCQETDVIELKDGRKVGISASAGGVCFPEDADTREVLINKLEHSLEYAKNTDRGTLVFFSEEIARKHERGEILREDLKHCIKNDFQGFELYYQPLIHPEKQTIVGCECLLRWQGEKIKDSYPIEFIKVLEDYGGIREVGYWVMEQAIKRQVEWRDTYKNLWVSFNVSYQQFMDDAFEERLDLYAKKYNVRPEDMIIELTESCAVSNPKELASMFNRLRRRGFKIALDDFGTAYASLEMLKSLQVDYIKIEHSFVRELAEPGHDIDFVIIDNLLELCRHLGCQSIVEGVENSQVADIVGTMDANLLQGYYYSRPVCLEDFEKLLAADQETKEANTKDVK